MKKIMKHLKPGERDDCENCMFSVCIDFLVHNLSTIFIAFRFHFLHLEDFKVYSTTDFKICVCVIKIFSN